MCEYPCLAGEYLYENGTCLSQCDSPFESAIEGGKAFCRFVCADYVYEDGECNPTCDSPLIIEVDDDGFNLCQNPCSSNQILYSNGSCLTSCTSLFMKLDVYGIDIC